MGEPAASGIQFRLAGPGDAAALTELFLAIDRHYWGAAPTPAVMAEHVRQRVLSATSCEIALAEIGGKAVGLATFAILYPAPGPSGQLFMKDLFTLATARGRGVGHALMTFLACLWNAAARASTGPRRPAIPKPSPSTTAWAPGESRRRSISASMARR
jgi:GNAT superfamily N-acetyltransferase